MTAGIVILIASLLLSGWSTVARGAGVDLLTAPWGVSAEGFTTTGERQSPLSEPLFGDRWDLDIRLASTADGAATRPPTRDTWMEPPREVVKEAPERPDGLFFSAWKTITIFELALLTVTAAAPREWTGWSDEFIADALDNFGEAYTMPPVWDTDSWQINYVGHPYGGSLYYNTIRCRGASKTESFLFTTLLSTQWEYMVESVAERPSIQDLIITPITGWILGEWIHNLTLGMAKGGYGVLEKVLLTVLNPMHTIYVGF